MRDCQHTEARQEEPVGVTMVFATMRSELKIHSRAVLQTLSAEKGVIWLYWALFCNDATRIPTLGMLNAREKHKINRLMEL